MSRSKYGKLIVASNITIAGSGYAGTVDVPAGDGGGVIGAQHVEVTWTRADPDPLAATGGTTYYGTGGFWTALITPGAPCDPQTVTLDLAKGQNGTPASVLEIFGGARTYRFVVAAQGKTVTFNCGGVPAPTLIGHDITVGVCESDQSGTGAGAVPYTDINKLASSGPAPAGTGAPSACPPNTTATWSFTPH